MNQNTGSPDQGFYLFVWAPKQLPQEDTESNVKDKQKIVRKK